MFDHINKTYLAIGLALVLVLFAFIFMVPEPNYDMPEAYSVGYNASEYNCINNREFCHYPLNLTTEGLNVTN